MVLEKGGYFRLGLGPKFGPYRDGQKISCSHSQILIVVNVLKF